MAFYPDTTHRGAIARLNWCQILKASVCWQLAVPSFSLLFFSLPSFITSSLGFWGARNLSQRTRAVPGSQMTFGAFWAKSASDKSSFTALQLCIRICPSVRLSVTHVNCDKTKKLLSTLYHRKDRCIQFSDTKNGWCGSLFYLKF